MYIPKSNRNNIFSVVHILFVTHTIKLTILYLESNTHYLVIYLVSPQILSIRKSEVHLG